MKKSVPETGIALQKKKHIGRVTAQSENYSSLELGARYCILRARNIKATWRRKQKDNCLECQAQET